MFQRITTNPRVLHGEPCIRGMRIPVHLIVEMVAAGMTYEDILRNYPDLERADIQAALEFAAYVTRERILPIRATA